MAKTLVLEWDSREARVIAIGQRGRKWAVEDAFVVPLPARDASAGDKVVGPMLKEALAQRGLGGGKCKVVVGRSSIELRYLTVPQAPSEEMPDLVRFQAMRQFSQLGEEWPLDFVVVSDSGETQTVLAASIVPSALDGLTDVCAAAGLTAEQVYLRPFAAAANVAGEAVIEGQERRLIVDVLSDEADLVVVDLDRPIFCRTVKLPSGEGAAEARNAALVGEIRRTVAAARNQIPGSEITHVSLFGVSAENAPILEKLRQANFTAEAIDPFVEVEPAAVTEVKPAQRGAFAPLVGIAHLLSGASTPSIDFLHPRQRPAPPDNRRRNLLAVAAGVMLLLAGCMGYFYWTEGVARRLTELDQQITKKKEEIKSYDDARAAMTAIENFEKTNISAVEKLAQVSENLPPADRVILTSLKFTAPQIMIVKGKPVEISGTLALTGGATESDLRQMIERKLEEVGPVTRENSPETIQGTKYSHQFVEKITVEIPKPPAKPASKPAQGATKTAAAPPGQANATKSK